MEYDLEILGKILAMIRFLERREQTIKEDLNYARRVGVIWYEEINEKYLADNHRAQERLKNRYNRILTQLERF